MKSLPVDVWMALDESIMYALRENWDNQILLINADITSKEMNKFKQSKVKFKTFSHTDEIVKRVSINKKLIYLYGIFSTTICAVHYLLLNGYTDIVLFGITNANNSNGLWQHFYDEAEIDHKSMDQRVEIQLQLEKLVKEFNANLYIAGYSKLSFPSINVDLLLKDSIIKEIQDISTIITLDITPELHTLQLPQICLGGTHVYLNDQVFEVVNDTITVEPEHSHILQTQGYIRI
jgi:hypothetical protein